ncbi:MAG: PmbA protein [Frankiales bacterium]|jgi:PmbA protein|nr:PmbA protein [Frankiales bacterium]
MTGDSDLLDLAQRVVDRAKAGEQVEAFATHGIGTSVTVFDGEVETLTSSESRGVGVRVIVEGRLGFASTSDVSDDGLAYALEEARSNAAYGTPDVGNVLPLPRDTSGLEPLPSLVAEGFDEVPTARKVAMAIELERLTRAADARVSGVAASVYGDGLSRGAVASTTGISAAYSRTDAYAYVSALARAGDETQTGLGLSMGRGAGDLDLEAAAREGALRSTRLLGATKPKTAGVPVVFDPIVTATFLGVLADAFSADSVQKGRSLLADKLGELVAGTGLSVIDDGRLPEGPGSAPFDDEGVPTGRTVLIDGGELRGWLHNTETAARSGDPSRSTGNASRSGHTSTPGVAASNLYLAGDETPVEEILRKAGTALYVQDVTGVHSGVNPVSGEFSVGATGLWVRDGELAEPVRELTVSSTILGMLKAVIALGDDRRFLPFGGSLAGATLLIEGMTVAGA